MRLRLTLELVRRSDLSDGETDDAEDESLVLSQTVPPYTQREVAVARQCRVYDSASEGDQEVSSSDDQLLKAARVFLRAYALRAEAKPTLASNSDDTSDDG
jgi:hypothetical protein